MRTWFPGSIAWSWESIRTLPVEVSSSSIFRMNPTSEFAQTGQSVAIKEGLGIKKQKGRKVTLL